MWAAGDVVEVPHGLSMLPIRGLTGSHAYAQGRTAAFNAAGRDLVYDPVWVPWGMVAGDYTIGGFSIGETLATAMGVPYVVAKGVGVSRARYFPGATRTHVKLLAEPDTLKIIGAQIHGGEGVKERCGLPRLRGQARRDARGPGVDGEHLLAADRRAVRADRDRRPERPRRARDASAPA